MARPRKLPEGVQRRVGRTGKVTYQARWRTRSGEVRSYTADTPGEAAEYRTEQLRLKRGGGSGDNRGGLTPFDSWWHQWMAGRRIRDTTRDRDMHYAAKHILPRWGDMALGDIQMQDVNIWVGELTDSAGLAPATALKHLRLVKQALDKAVLSGLIVSNPTAGVEPPRPDDIEARFLTDIELLMLEDAMDPWWALTVPFLADTGLRIGELSALRLEDVNLLAGTVTVRSTATYVSKLVSETTRHEDDPKSRAGRRVVPTLTEEVAERLAAIVAERHISPTDRLFTGPRGGPLSPNNYRGRILHPAAVKAGLDEPLPTPHSLRHTAVARWIETGGNEYQIARWAGHRTTASLQRTYGHLLRHDAEEERTLLSDSRTRAREQLAEERAREAEVVVDFDRHTKKSG